MNEVSAWEQAKEKLEKSNLKYEVFGEKVVIRDSEGKFMCNFYSGMEAIWYMYGYESGKLDSTRVSKV